MTEKERIRKWADANRKRAAEYKLKVGCVECGYKENAFALEFDHKENLGVPFSGKQRSVASMMYAKWDRIWEEIQKCDVVCSNHHAIRTFKRRKVG